MNSECQWKKKTEQQGKRKKSVSAVEKGRLGGVIKRKLTGYKQQKASKTNGADRQNRLRIPISYNSGRRIHSTGSDPVYHTILFALSTKVLFSPDTKRKSRFIFHLSFAHCGWFVFVLWDFFSILYLSLYDQVRSCSIVLFKRTNRNRPKKAIFSCFCLSSFSSIYLLESKLSFTLNLL